jgi:hypothetical protein
MTDRGNAPVQRWRVRGFSKQFFDIKERLMKVETIIIKDFNDIVYELTEVLAKLGACFAVDEFFPL